MSNLERKSQILLTGIILLAFFLRFWAVGEVPAGMNRDEVGMGYDAYSILRTGRDQFGAFLPLTLRSADDYKPALYTYTIIPFIPVFGLNAVSVRLPSILFGTATVGVVYFLVRILLKVGGPASASWRIAAPPTFLIPFLAAFFLAISPWHIQYSRGAFEANAAVFFVTSGVTAFLSGMRSPKSKLLAEPSSFGAKSLNLLNIWHFFSNNKWFLLSGIFFGFSLLTYHSARFMTPVLILMLLLFFHRELALRWKQLLVFLAVVGAFCVLILPSVVSPEAQVRYRALSIFSKEYLLDASAADIALDAKAGVEGWGRIFHNRRFIPFTHDALAQLTENYIRHFNPGDLLFGRHGPRLQQVNHAPDVGVVYPWEAVLAIIGIGVLSLSLRSRLTLFLLGWLLLAFIPAAITYDIPSYVRSIFALPVIQIFAAVGLVAAVGWGMRQSRLLTGVGLAVFTVGLLSSFSFFLHQYFVHLNIEEAEDWRFGRKEAAEGSWAKRSQYDRVVVSTLLDDPHAHFLFHLKIDPAWYLSQGGTKGGGWTAVENRLENVEFRRFVGQGEFVGKVEEGVLYVGLAREFPPLDLKLVRVVDEIMFPNGKPGILLVEKSPRI